VIPEFTTICAVDPEHLPELAAVFPTWWHFKPEIFQRPFWVLRDIRVHVEDIFVATNGAVDRIITVEDSDSFESQREKMLNALVYVAQHIETPYYLKLDTDTVATGHGQWIKPEWFEGNPVFVASPWGYTKPAEFIERLDAWANINHDLEDYPPPKRKIEGNIARSRRIISWCMFGETAFTKMAISLFAGEKMPAPSQDTTLWYIAERLALPYRRVKMKKHGWRHVHGLNRIRHVANEALIGHRIPRGGGFPERESVLERKIARKMNSDGE